MVTVFWSSDVHLKGSQSGTNGGRPSQLGTETWKPVYSRGYSAPIIMGIDPVDVGVGMANHAHAYVLGDLPALQVGDHGMPKTVKALTGHLILPGLGIIWVHPRVGQYANKGLAKAADRVTLNGAS